MPKSPSPGKILIICPFTSPNQGGVESHIQKLVKFLGRKGRQVIILSYQPLTTPTKAPVYEKKENYEIYRLPWLGHGLFPKIEHNPALTFVYLVPGLLLESLAIGVKRRHEIAVIHAHGFAAGFVGVILRALTSKRLVLSTHAIYNLGTRKYLAAALTAILNRCDFILAVSQTSAKELVASGVSGQKVKVHPNWVDTSFFSPAPGKRKKGSNLKVIFNGRGLEKKGIFLFGNLARENPELNFIARVAPDRDRQKFIQEYKGVPNLEIRTGLPDNFEEKMRIIRDEYRESDIFLMPSLYPEGFSASLLEAASCGLVVISSNLGSLPSILAGSGAVLVKPTLRNFHRSLDELVRDKNTLLKRKRRQMRKYAQKKFSEKNARVIYGSYGL